MSRVDYWQELAHFTRAEFNEPDKMNEAFIRKLDAYRSHFGRPFKILESYATTGHLPGSYHYQGLAVDMRLLDNSGQALDLDEHLVLAMGAPFGGIGIYTWSPNGVFVHFDDRPYYERRRIWVCRDKGKYEPFSAQFLVDFLGK